MGRNEKDNCSVHVYSSKSLANVIEQTYLTHSTRCKCSDSSHGTCWGSIKASSTPKWWPPQKIVRCRFRMVRFQYWVRLMYTSMSTRKATLNTKLTKPKRSFSTDGQPRMGQHLSFDVFNIFTDSICSIKADVSLSRGISGGIWGWGKTKSCLLMIEAQTQVLHALR